MVKEAEERQPGWEMKRGKEGVVGTISFVCTCAGSVTSLTWLAARISAALSTDRKDYRQITER